MNATVAAPRVLCFGEVLARLATHGGEQLAFADRLDLHIGGAEANVAAALAWLGNEARLVTALPQGPLGERALVHLRSRGVDCSAILRGEGRLGLYFVSTGASLRPSEIFYDRAGSAFVHTNWQSLDWPLLLADTDLLHVSGISLALSADSAAAVICAMRAARTAGVRVSLDANFRARLWQGQNRDPAAVLAEALGFADLFFGDHHDATLLLGTAFDAQTPRVAAQALLDAFPNLSLVAATHRQSDSVEQHELSARIDTRSAQYATPPRRVAGIVERIGAGDAFAAGVLDALLRDEPIDVIAQRGLSLACLKQAQPGDAAAVDRAQLDAFGDGALDIRR